MNESSKKPVCKLIGTDGNAFALISQVCTTLKRASMGEEAVEFKNKAYDCPSYDALLDLIHQYVAVR